MKNRLVLIALGLVTLMGWETPSQAQYYDYNAYNNNAYLNYAIASQKAKATGRRARISKRSKSKHRKHSTKRTRRFSKHHSRR